MVLQLFHHYIFICMGKFYMHINLCTPCISEPADAEEVQLVVRHHVGSGN